MIRMQFSSAKTMALGAFAASSAAADMVLLLFVYTITYIIYVVCWLSFQFQVVSSTAVWFFSAWNAKWK